MNQLERRIDKIEKNVPVQPCKKPGHDTLIFMGHPPLFGEAPEIRAQIKDIRECELCKDRLVIIFGRFTRPVEEVTAPGGRMTIRLDDDEEDEN